jgi:CDGSH-type Zn-finger protein
MDKPIISDNQPRPLQLVKGREYEFCTCGRSNSQPLCDNAHRGTSFEPLDFKATESGEKWLCMCKHSGNLPYCDGTHKRFKDEQVGEVG